MGPSFHRLDSELQQISVRGVIVLSESYQVSVCQMSCLHVAPEGKHMQSLGNITKLNLEADPYYPINVRVRPDVHVAASP